MRNLLMIFAATVLLNGTVAKVSAAERAGDVAKSTLGNMGLGSMQPMSDDAGLAVRGKGTFVHVWGPTYNITHVHFAFGSNASSTGVGFSAGFSVASAH
jgi:hypothetical protein